MNCRPVDQDGENVQRDRERRDENQSRDEAVLDTLERTHTLPGGLTATPDATPHTDYTCERSFRMAPRPPRATSRAGRTTL